MPVSLSLVAPHPMLRFLTACLLVGGLSLPAQAQYTLRADRAGTGHAAMTGGSYTLQGTAGQPVASIVGAAPVSGTPSEPRTSRCRLN